MQIRVYVPKIEDSDMESILNYYNTHKKETDEPLERLNRAEGGFQIQITDLKDVSSINTNEKIKQLRWKRRYLVPEYGFPYFEDGEQALLFESMKSVLGDNVVYE